MYGFNQGVVLADHPTIAVENVGIAVVRCDHRYNVKKRIGHALICGGPCYHYIDKKGSDHLLFLIVKAYQSRDFQKDFVVLEEEDYPIVEIRKPDFRLDNPGNCPVLEPEGSVYVGGRRVFVRVSNRTFSHPTVETRKSPKNGDTAKVIPKNFGGFDLVWEEAHP